ncbi:MAG: hypothetical protein WBW76_08965 [Candidatus Cybelea sp.]
MQRAAPTLRWHLLWLAVGLLAAGCGGAQGSSPAMPGAIEPVAAARARSWMAPDAKNLDLLYVSDYMTNDVDAYSFPQGKLSGVLRGILKGFVSPSGLCADKSGDVFIPDSSNSTILEYAHGSTHLVRTLNDRGAVPYSCTVDPSSGDLAVVNIVSSHGPGSVVIYARPRGRPKRYNFGSVFLWYFAAYDDRGNLFVDAADDVPSEPMALLELARGSSGLAEVDLDQTIHAPGGVGWDGKHLTVADSDASVIYRFSIAGTAGIKVGTTALRRGHFVTQYVIAGNDVIGANYHGANVVFWKYPAGGTPIKTIGGFGEPFGITLSPAPK